MFASRNLGIQGRSQKRSGKRRGRHRGTGRGGPKEAEEVIVIVEALEIMVTWVGQVWALVVRGFKGCRGGLRGS